MSSVRIIVLVGLVVAMLALNSCSLFQRKSSDTDGQQQEEPTLSRLAAPGSRPTGLAWDGQNLWVSDEGTNRIYKLSLSSGEVLESFPGPGSSPQGLTWDGEALWVADPAMGRLYRVDVNTKAVLTSVKAPGEGIPLAIAWVEGQLWVADAPSQRIYQLTPGDGRVLRSFAAPGPVPDGMAFDGRNLWVADLTQVLFRIDPQEGRVLDEDRFPVGSEVKGLVWIQGEPWIADAARSEIVRFPL